jgi:membrane peptidoglycan carboxypeptidase
MNDPNRGTNPDPGQGRRRPNKNIYTTRSGNTIKLHQSLGERVKARKNSRAMAKAMYLSTLPKNPFKRILYRMHPKRVTAFWFSRQGALLALKIAGIGIVVCFFLAVGVFAYFRKDLPKINDLSGDKLGGSITYYDRTGQTVLWQDYDGVKRVPVAGDQISNNMREATVAIEDKDFYKHGAFDVRGILRAGFNDARGGSTQGGSTITQQLVKINEQWTADRSITRKVKELILAVELEREYSKADILNGYLNIAPYGGVEYGVQSASEDYFGIDAKDLSLAQAAMLASIPKAPTAYSPYSDPEWNPSATDSLFDKAGLLGRQQYVLDQMASQHMITQAQADAAKKVDILAEVKPLQPKYQDIKAPYFVLAAKQELEEKYGAATVDRGGWQVTTTLDLKLQASAEQLVASNLPTVEKLTGGAADEEATVAEDVPTGQIVALVGGVDFSNPDYGQNNYAAGILIPPGSSFKPYDYTTLINNNNNVGAGSVMYDSQGPLPGYPCTNKALPLAGGNCLEDYDFLYPGPITLRYALGGSRNVPAVKAMLSAVPNDTSTGKVNSINKVITTASAMMDNPYIKGNTYNCYADQALTQQTQCYGASAIGDGAFLHLDDHVNGLATLGRLGSAIPKTYILKITDASGKIVDQFKQPVGNQVVKADAAYIVDNMASDPNASYLPGSCTSTTCTTLAHGGYKFQRDNGSTFAVKTGTTNDGFDGLMTSWSSKYAVVSWVGNHQRNKDLSAASGAAMETLTEPLTRGMMEAAEVGKPPATWTAPADVKTAPAFVVRNHIHYGDIEPSPSNDLFPSWYVGKSTTSTSQTIDKVSGNIATNCTPALARTTSTNSNVATWNVDLWNGGSPNTTSTATTTTTKTDDVHSCNDTPPSITVTAPATCDADEGGCTITATATQGTHALTDPAYSQFPGTVNFTINGQIVKTASVSDSPSTVSFTYLPTTSGNITVTAQVIDSVLYQATDTATFTATVANPLTFSSAQAGTGNNAFTKFVWSGGTAPYTVTRADNSLNLCTTSDTNCQVAKSSAPSGTKVIVQDSNNESDTTTVQ